MYDPVTEHILKIQKKRYLRECSDLSEGIDNAKCSLCGEKTKDLYNGRCIHCQTRIERAKFHLQTPPSKVQKVHRIKK